MKKTILITMLFVAFAFTANTPAQEVSSFVRQEVVVVSGDPLTKLFGTTPEKLSLYAMTSAGFEPVPFQIDQRYRSRISTCGGEK